MRSRGHILVLIAATACAATSEPPKVAEPAPPSAAACEPTPPIDVAISPDEPVSEQQPAQSFEPAPIPWTAKTLMSRGRRGCWVHAVLDPDVVVVYSMIDVYALIGRELALRSPLPELAERPPCAGGVCQPDAPNAVLLEDAGSSPIDGRAFGFVVPIADGFWVLPLERVYREQRCIPDVEVSTVEDGQARVVYHAVEVVESAECDPDEECEYGCFHGEAKQYDLFYDAESQRALLVTRSHDAHDEDDEPTPSIEVTREADAVRIVGCKADHTIPWPPQE